jgi:NAD(P)-dependent dehydrogenase (short-subunit alcohol dehydrogenase family)
LAAAYVTAVLGGFADVVGGCAGDADGDVLYGAAPVIGQSQGSLALDAAFNNAGAGHLPTALADLALADFDTVLRVNARGIFLMMKHQIPAMLAAGGGAIVNMSSTAGLSGTPGMAAYTAAKHAIIGLTETAALDLGAQGIRVNAIAPGPIFTHNLARADDAARARIGGHPALHRLGQPEEVAATAAWLCSDQASFITGTTIPIDGGKLAAAATL